MIRDNKWINQFRDIKTRISNLNKSQKIIIEDFIDHYIYQDENGKVKYEKEAFEFENVIHCLLNELSCEYIIDKIKIEDFNNDKQKKLKTNIILNNNKIEINILASREQIMTFNKIYQINKKNNNEFITKRLIKVNQNPKV